MAAAVKAIYRGHLASITENMGNPSKPTDDATLRRAYPLATTVSLGALRTLWDMDGAILDHELWVSFCDPDLIVDPTDDQVAAAR